MQYIVLVLSIETWIVGARLGTRNLFIFLFVSEICERVIENRRVCTLR